MVEPVVHVEYIGLERSPVVVVDAFAPDPDRLIAEAAGLDFQTLGPYYPGVRAPVGRGYFDGLSALLATIAREVFEAGDRLNFDRALYSVSHTPPGRLSLVQRIPHIDDVGADRLAIVHYLSHEDFGGTAFYRHRSTGFETISADRHRAYLDALRADLATHGEPPAAYIAGDTALFVRTKLQTPAFNRAVIYPAKLLHCAAIPNGRLLPERVQEGRLTVASFLTAR